VPLVTEALNWQHGTYLGATIESETTAAATGAVGVVRRDPMAMLPFCGYNMGDYWAHWLGMREKLSNAPRIFRVNWFRTDENGRYIWPGFGENLKVIDWALRRCEGKASAVESPLGLHPKTGDLSSESVSDASWNSLLGVDRDAWKNAMPGEQAFFAGYGARLPEGIQQEHQAQATRLG
jgi:phosphoenolpyruvate carboxykinase (GTP)